MPQKLDSLQNLRIDSIRSAVNSLNHTLIKVQDTTINILSQIHNTVADTGVFLPALRAASHKERIWVDYIPAWALGLTALLFIGNIVFDRIKEGIKTKKDKEKEKTEKGLLIDFLILWHDRSLINIRLFSEAFLLNSNNLIDLDNNPPLHTFSFDLDTIVNRNKDELYRILIKTKEIYSEPITPAEGVEVELVSGVNTNNSDFYNYISTMTAINLELKTYCTLVDNVYVKELSAISDKVYEFLKVFKTDYNEFRNWAVGYNNTLPGLGDLIFQEFLHEFFDGLDLIMQKWNTASEQDETDKTQWVNDGNNLIDFKTKEKKIVFDYTTEMVTYFMPFESIHLYPPFKTVRTNLTNLVIEINHLAKVRKQWGERFRIASNSMDERLNFVRFSFQRLVNAPDID